MNLTNCKPQMGFIFSYSVFCMQRKVIEDSPPDIRYSKEKKTIRYILVFFSSNSDCIYATLRLFCIKYFMEQNY